MPFQMGVLGLKDDAHAARAQDLEDAIGTQPAQLPRLLRRRRLTEEDLLLLFGNRPDKRGQRAVDPGHHRVDSSL